MNISVHDLTRTIIEQQRVIRELREQLVASEQRVKAFEEYAMLQARVEKLESALLEAKLQIEYLHGKFLETGSGNAVLDTIRRVLGEK